MYRRMFWALLAALVLLLVGVGWVYLTRDRLLGTAIRTYGPQITGVSVKLGGARLEPWDGEAALTDLELGNPPGFHTPHALMVAQIRLRLDVSNLRSDVVHIRDIRVEQPRVTYEYASGGSNLDVIQRHIERQIADAAGPAGAQGAPAAPGSATANANAKPLRVVIDHVDILGAQADVSASALHGRTVTVNLPDIHLNDIGTRNGGVTPAQATEQMVAAVRQAATQAVVPLHLDGVVQRARNGAAALADKVRGLFK